MKEAQAIINYIDMQMQPIRPQKLLTGEVGQPVKFDIPKISGYRYAVQMITGLNDEQIPTFVEPNTVIKYQADRTLQFELRYQKLPTPQPKRADAKQWVAQADHKFLVKSQQETIPVFGDDQQQLLQTVLQPNTFGTYTQQKEVDGQVYYLIAPHQWVRASDVVLVDDKAKVKQPKLWQVTPVDYTVIVKIPDNMQAVLWQIDSQSLAQTKLESHLVDNGTKLKIDAEILIAGEIFYHIVNSNWIKAKYVSREN
ncbi:hypothetical protein [Bombilactobacillus bombi]|uniref:hypothetical protein n=1 Tax=Bombilactobacillus bombi TaxID=1303590 RepID=UPI0015E5A77B|nr:hypothetical protein [Bombilactobacillus bombi]MBA1434297.1 hypothetical protein [Bombilactobacillus bombi]